MLCGAGYACYQFLPSNWTSFLRTNNEVEHHLSSKGGGRGGRGRGGTGIGNDSGYRYRVEKKNAGNQAWWLSLAISTLGWAEAGGLP